MLISRSLQLIIKAIYYYKNYLFKVMLFYLFFISIFLELMHLVISQRGFEIKDLVGNITGVILSIIIIKAVLGL